MSCLVSFTILVSCCLCSALSYLKKSKIPLPTWGMGRTRLPKFKFSANFPIGLHVILQKLIKKAQYLMWKIILTKNPLKFNLELLLK